MPEIPASELKSRERKLFANAQVAFERGNFEYAIEICSDVLAVSPGCLEVRKTLRTAQQRVFAKSPGGLKLLAWRLGAVVTVLRGQLVLARNPTRAMAIGEGVLWGDPFHAQALSLVAAGAAKLALNETEAFCLETICDRYPDSADKLERLCKSLISVGQTGKALMVAEQLSTLRPQNAQILELVKSASVAHSINRGQWAEGEKDFRSKLKDRRESERLERSGHLVSDAIEREDRLQDIIAAVHRDPQNLDNYKLLIRAYSSNEDYRSALLWLEKAQALPAAESDAMLRYFRSELKIASVESQLADLRVDAEDHANEIEDLEGELKRSRLHEARDLVEQFPSDLTQRFKYGELLLEAGEVDGAIQQFQTAQRNPSLKQAAAFNLAKCFVAKKLDDLALEHLERVNAALASMDAFKKEVVYQIGSCFERLGKTEEAIQRFKIIYSSDIGYKDVAAKVDAYYRDSK